MVIKLLKLRKKRSIFLAKRFRYFSLVLSVICIFFAYSISSNIFLQTTKTNNLLILIPVIFFAYLYSEIFYFKIVYKIGGGK